MEEALECVARGPQGMLDRLMAEEMPLRDAYLVCLQHFGGRLYYNGDWSWAGRSSQVWSQARWRRDEDQQRLTRQELNATIHHHFQGDEVIIDPTYDRIMHAHLE